MKTLFAFIASALFAVVALNAARADAPAEPTIRTFDTPTVEKLGRAMYEQDQLAWKATDIAIARYTEDGIKSMKGRGWLIEPTASGTVVRFVHDTPDGSKFYFEVNFTNGAAIASEPDPNLNDDELAQWRARTLALENFTLRCSDRYNTIVLKDPERDGWLIWVMPATTDPNMTVLGGHTRFSISADGRTIVEKDQLSKACLNIPKPLANSGDPTGILGQQLVSLQPLETSVFVSLSYKTPIFIGTLDGKVWKFDGDRISNVDADAGGGDGFSSRALAGLAENCRIIATKPDETPAKYYVRGTTTVINATEKSAAFELDVEPGYKPVSVMCGRLDFALMPNDYKVLLAGYTLFISDIGAGHPKRLGSLEMVNGQFQFRTTSGPKPTEEQMAKINARLNAFQDAVQKKQ